MKSTYFNKGCEHYHRQEYTKAIECFQLSIAKDLYQTAFPRLYGQQYRPLDNSQDNSRGSRQDNSRGSSEFTIWLGQRLETLKKIEVGNEQSRFIQGLGNKLEIGGQAICNLNRNLFNEGRWRYLHL